MIDIYIYFKSSLAKLSGAQVETQPGEDHSDDPWMPQNPGNPPVWVRGASYSEESYRALWTSQEGRALPADGTGWVWLGTTPNTHALEAERAWSAAHPDRHLRLTPGTRSAASGARFGSTG